jgi:uncharacterized protein (DUF427 family)
MAEGSAGRAIDIVPNTKRVRVTFAGRIVADTTRALTLFEAGHAPVQYVPPGDVDASLLTRTQRRTHCPYKGEARYYTIAVAGRASENAVWTYEQPIPSVAAIAGYLAFYPGRVDAIDELPV